MNVWRLAAASYTGLGVTSAAAVILLRQGNPLQHPSPWWEGHGSLPTSLSALGGLFFALGVITLTRWSVARYAWAQSLHRELRSVVCGIRASEIILLALLSSSGEELFFRSLLVPWLGVLPAGLLFGLVHQLPGPSRWVWVAWATLAGVGFGVLFALTGSLVGSLLAHALINATNLFFLRDHPLEVPPPSLGGLLRRSSKKNS